MEPDITLLTIVMAEPARAPTTSTEPRITELNKSLDRIAELDNTLTSDQVTPPTRKT